MLAEAVDLSVTAHVCINKCPYVRVFVRVKSSDVNLDFVSQCRKKNNEIRGKKALRSEFTDKKYKISKKDGYLKGTFRALARKTITSEIEEDNLSADLPDQRG